MDWMLGYSFTLVRLAGVKPSGCTCMLEDGLYNYAWRGKRALRIQSRVVSTSSLISVESGFFEDGCNTVFQSAYRFTFQSLVLAVSGGYEDTHGHENRLR